MMATNNHNLDASLLPFRPKRRNVLGRGLRLMLAVALSGMTVVAQALTLEALDYTPLPGGNIEVTVQLSGPAPEPGAFTIETPARLALDFPATQLGSFKERHNIETGVLRSIRAIEAGNRTRLVFNLSRVVPYEIRTRNNFVYLTLEASRTQQAVTDVPESAVKRVIEQDQAAENTIGDIDFRRIDADAGRIVITLSDPGVIVDMKRRADKLVVDFLNSQLPEKLERRLNVKDFATPVSTIDAFNRDGGVRMVVAPEGEYEHLAYQIGDTYTIDIKRPPEEEEAAAGREEEYTGEKLSLNFQDIDVRAVLQLIGDFTGLNVVASDTVQGSITLRLKNVPWDQALDIILKAKGLGMRKTGNVVMIAPAEEIAAREKAELEARQQIEELAPMYTEFFSINYAKATNIAELLKAEANSLLSARGNVTIDERTNTLMVLDTAEKLEEIRKVIARLDIPVRQVLIESRIVVANDDFSKSLGVRAGVTAVAQQGTTGMISTTGTTTGSGTMVSSAVSNVQNNNTIAPVTLPSLANRYNVNLPASGATGQVALAILGSDYLVDLELSAAQQEGKGEVISNPRVITSNQREATIEQGVEIPYQEATSSGATSVSFKKAVLSLTVTPQITPDDRVAMDLRVSKDSAGAVYNGIPAIDTREVATQVLVNNGDTVVLGGIYEQTVSDSTSKVPVLGDLPVLGRLFRRDVKRDDKAELLIFVTPKILKEGMQAASGLQ